MDILRKGYRLFVIGDLKVWIGNRVRASITGPFGVSGENHNGRRLVEFCAKRLVCVGDTLFE